MKQKILVLGAALAVAGCSTMTPARYAVSVDNNQALKQYQGKQIKIDSMSAQGDYDAGCRMMGPIHTGDGMSIPDFIGKAFNDEFKFAGLYSDNGVVLKGTMTKIEFSSISGVTGGWWDLAVSITSNNGKSLSEENRYSFSSGFDAITACNQTAQALTPAVQDLIKKTVTDPQFQSLLE